MVVVLARIITRAGRIWIWSRRLYWWSQDIVSASYFATEWHDDVLNPDSETVLHVVAKTRGGQQYYQNDETLAFDLSWHDLAGRVRPMVNPNQRLSELEAEGRNRALSVQRKALSGGLVLLVGLVLEVAGVDISILT